MHGCPEKGSHLTVRSKFEAYGSGIIGMQARAAVMKGTLEIESSPGEGTTVLARIPLT
jgi:signal transduction histidine kinase